MNIYVCCDSGNTSKYFAECLGKECETEALVFNIKDITKQDFDSYNNILAYGPSTYLLKRDKAFIEAFDMIILAPQVRHKGDLIRGLYAKRNIKVKDIDMLTFATMDGKAAWKDILNGER
ncbi:MAG: hypothetical protein RR929_03975 [Erysipelotrichaceae bacterium]